MMEKAVTSVAVPEVGGDGAEVSLLAQLGDAEHLAHVLEGDVGVLVFDPHGLGCVDGEPPPMAMIQSGWKASMAAAPRMTVSTLGSGSMPSNSWTSMPASFR